MEKLYPDTMPSQDHTFPPIFALEHSPYQPACAAYVHLDLRICSYFCVEWMHTHNPIPSAIPCNRNPAWMVYYRSHNLTWMVYYRNRNLTWMVYFRSRNPTWMFYRHNHNPAWMVSGTSNRPASHNDRYLSTDSSYLRRADSCHGLCRSHNFYKNPNWLPLTFFLYTSLYVFVRKM